jgi:hypothetical protein
MRKILDLRDYDIFKKDSFLYIHCLANVLGKPLYVKCKDSQLLTMGVNPLFPDDLSLVPLTVNMASNFCESKCSLAVLRIRIIGSNLKFYRLPTNDDPDPKYFNRFPVTCKHPDMLLSATRGKNVKNVFCYQGYWEDRKKDLTNPFLETTEVSGCNGLLRLD